MPDAAWALQRSVYAALLDDVPIVSLLGGDHIYDDVPQGTAFPYVTFGQSTLRDWSSGGELGAEHVLTLHVWSRASGRKETYIIMSALREALHDKPLVLDGHRLVNIRHEVSEARRETDGDTYHGIVRYRAVTEPE